MNDHVKELLYQMLETELGGVQVYTTALECVVNDDLKREWSKYLEETNRHVEVMRELFDTLGLDPATQTPGRQVVHHVGRSLVKAMTAACEEVEDQEDEHVYHSKGWCRELWIQALGMPAVLPPPEEEKSVTTAIGAARAEIAREAML